MSAEEEYYDPDEGRAALPPRLMKILIACWLAMLVAAPPAGLAAARFVTLYVMTKAAAEGNAMAEATLGTMYLEGDWVVKRNAEEAFQWLLLAATQGNTDAQSNLGLMYYQGVGIPQDYAKAFEWTLRAANKGDPEAQDGLGDMYRDGDGTAPDPVQAYMWYSLAAGVEIPHRENILKRRDALGAKLTQQQLAEARGLVSAWEPAAPP